MPPDASPSALLDLLLAQLAEIQRGADHSVECECALRHARACEEWLAAHDERIAKRAAEDAARVSGASG